MTQILRLEDANGVPCDNWMVFGEAVRIHIDPAHIVDGLYRTASPRPVVRGGGPADYFEIGEDARFLIRRPVPAPGTER